MNGFNGVYRKYFLLMLNNIMTIISVCGQVIYITFHDRLILVVGMGIITLANFSTTYLIITYYKLGQIHESSQKCIGSWKRYGGLELRPIDRKLVKRYVKSLRSCRVELGDFGYYRKATSSRIIVKLVFYTTKGIMIINKFL